MCARKARLVLEQPQVWMHVFERCRADWIPMVEKSFDLEETIQLHLFLFLSFLFRHCFSLIIWCETDPNG